MRTAHGLEFKSTLFATVSVCAVLSGQASALEAPVEEVVITGTLIEGGQVIGVPVTTLGPDDFEQTGAITITDLLRTVPTLVVSPSVSPNMVGGNFLRASTVDIHGLNAFTGSPRTLVLIDGRRYPYTGQTGEKADISFLPELAIDRLDVVVTGASATYGSDAMAGVVNAILRRNFDGAITQISAGTPEGGGAHWTASQLYGRSWDSGNITLAFTHYEVKRLPGSARPDVWTTDFRPWGLDNRTNVRVTTPGLVSQGNPNVGTGTGCTNCFSVPKGQNGIGLTWAALLANAGVKNQIDGYATGEGIPPQTSNAITGVFDQDLMPGFHLFGEGYYSNRRGLHITNPVNGTGRFSTLTLAVPTSNPFYPVGAPAGLRVSYNFVTELPPSTSYYEVNGRYALGLDVELPYGWEGTIQGSQSATTAGFRFFNIPNVTTVNAALGTPQFVPAAGQIPAMTVTKPANVPFLNLFCDPTAFECNSPAVLNYIKSGETSRTHQILNQFDATATGTVLMIPGGEVRLAVGGSLIRHYFEQENLSDFGQASPTVPFLLRSNDSRKSYALFAELQIPVVSEANAMPFLRRLDVQVSGRYDNYERFGPTTNPRAAIDWMPIDGLTLRGAWGTSFRAPSFVDLNLSPLIRPLNPPAGGEEEFQSCPAVGGSPIPGSFGATLNPTCSAALMFPGGISVEGGSDDLNVFERGPVSPEESEDYSLGFHYAPTGNFLSGLDINVAYWNINISGLITNIRNDQASLLDPATAFVFTGADAPGFADKVNRLIADPSALEFAPGAAPNILFLVDALTRNVGTLKSDGFDFSADYDWAGGNIGDFSIGLAGTYYIKRESSLLDTSEPVDVFDIDNALAFVNGAVVVVNGQSQAVRLRYRGHIGWTMDGMSIVGFVNYRSHLHYTGQLPPTSVMLASGITTYANLLPSLYTFDLAMAYDLADRPTNSYLQNLRFSLVVNNILDRKPPFAYQVLGGSTGTVAFLGSVDSPVGRDFTFTITKTW